MFGLGFAISSRNERKGIEFNDFYSQVCEKGFQFFL